MRLILLTMLAFFQAYAFGQIGEIKTPPINSMKYINNNDKIHSVDTSLKIIYRNNRATRPGPAYYLNGEYINSSLLMTLNPDNVSSIRVEKQNAEVNNIRHEGQIFIETKENYKPDYISLGELKSTYAVLKEVPALFIIDNEIIKDYNYDKYILDRNYLLRIYIETIENPDEGIRLNLIRILTKTDENIRKVNEIRIRGDSTAGGEYE